MKIVTTGLHANTAIEKKHLFKLVVFLCRLEDLETKRYLVCPLGALIAQGLFYFSPNLCKPLIDSFLAISIDDLLAWCLDPMGSRAIEAFLKGKNVDLASKSKFIKRLKDHWIQLATSAFGSHIVDVCWELSAIELKESIVQELAEKDRELQNNFHGKFVYRNCKVESYKAKKQEWRDKEESVQRKKEMFKDLVETKKKEKIELDSRKTLPYIPCVAHP